MPTARAINSRLTFNGKRPFEQLRAIMPPELYRPAASFPAVMSDVLRAGPTVTGASTQSLETGGQIDLVQRRSTIGGSEQRQSGSLTACAVASRAPFSRELAGRLAGVG